MTYVSLYRKYRSQTFSDVVGQDHVTRTLQNAIKSGRIGHAYLFCGSRGTGKTSVARLLAKSVNCEHGPTPTPCGECDACRSITDGSAVDVVELDAASHRGIDDVRELRDNVKYPPMHLRYKVYVIDEAHQLSDAAKDAFLKTLEEPPAHAIFVLATTEAHEIPLTIRSRCQQFDFRRGSLSDIVDRLKYVLNNEGRKYDDEAVQILGRCAQGSYRDSLSLLEQVMAYTDENLTALHVNTVLGMVDEDVLFEVSEVVANEDAAAAFELAGRLIHEGKDIRELLKALASHFRDLLAASVGAGGDASVKLSERARRFTRERLVGLVEVFSAAEKDLRWNEQHRLALEMSLLKAITGPTQQVVRAAAPVAAPAVAPPLRTAPRAPEPPIQRPQPAAPKPPAARAAAPEPVEPVPPVNGELTVDQVRRLWSRILAHIRDIQNKKLFLGVLRDAQVVALEGSTVVLGFEERFSFHIQKLQQPEYMDVIKRAMEAVLGRKLGVKAVSIGASDQTAALALEPAAEEVMPPVSEGGGDLVKDVLDMFGGQLREETDDGDDKPLEGGLNA